MKKTLCMLLVGIILCAAFCGCGNDNYSNYDNDYNYSNDDNDYSYSNDNYDYDKGYGYTAPEPGESFSDYVKRQDPDLYNDMKDRWDSLS